jgi:hypothetical protein
VRRITHSPSARPDHGIVGRTTLAGRSLGQALEEGKIDVDLRYRYEHVEQKGFDEDAHASTLRLGLRFGFGAYYGFSAYVDFEVLGAIVADDYNSTANGKDEELNQAYLAYSAPKKTVVRLGRKSHATQLRF